MGFNSGIKGLNRNVFITVSPAPTKSVPVDAMVTHHGQRRAVSLNPSLNTIRRREVGFKSRLLYPRESHTYKLL
jgi:hypothetical protein